MAASNELLVVHLEERIGGGEKLGMEDNLEEGGEREREKLVKTVLVIMSCKYM